MKKTQKKQGRSAGGRWKAGQSGNPKGRPKGVPNKATIEVKEFSREFIGDPEYLESLRRRILKGEARHIETLLWHYAFGKPKESIVHSNLTNLEDLVLASYEGTEVNPEGH